MTIQQDPETGRAQAAATRSVRATSANARASGGTGQSATITAELPVVPGPTGVPIRRAPGINAVRRQPAPVALRIFVWLLALVLLVVATGTVVAGVRPDAALGPPPHRHRRSVGVHSNRRRKGDDHYRRSDLPRGVLERNRGNVRRPCSLLRTGHRRQRADLHRRPHAGQLGAVGVRPDDQSRREADHDLDHRDDHAHDVQDAGVVDDRVERQGPRIGGPSQGRRDLYL